MPHKDLHLFTLITVARHQIRSRMWLQWVETSISVEHSPQASGWMEALAHLQKCKTFFGLNQVFKWPLSSTSSSQCLCLVTLCPQQSSQAKQWSVKLKFPNPAPTSLKSLHLHSWQSESLGVAAVWLSRALALLSLFPRSTVSQRVVLGRFIFTQPHQYCAYEVNFCSIAVCPLFGNVSTRKLVKECVIINIILVMIIIVKASHHHHFSMSVINSKPPLPTVAVWVTRLPKLQSQNNSKHNWAIIPPGSFHQYHSKTTLPEQFQA